MLVVINKKMSHEIIHNFYNYLIFATFKENTNKMPYTEKIAAFEYILNKLEEWHIEAFGSFSPNNLSQLKVFKLHFFICAVSSKDKETSLLEVFNNFHALPFGPVESTVYNSTKDLKYYRLTKRELIKKEPFQAEINPEIAKKIDYSVNVLKQINFKLIQFSAFELVNLSHDFISWKRTYNFAQRLNRNSFKIPDNLIKLESISLLSKPSSQVYAT